MRIDWFNWRAMVAWAAADGDAGAGASSADAEAAKPVDAPAESVLFPNDKTAAPEADAKPVVGADWKEYVADPAKSEADNAAAKAEHDKTKPADKSADDAANKVPEDGKYTLVMPEGVAVDDELLAALSPDFKELGLTQGQAQKLADKFIASQQARAAKQTETWAGTVSGWVDQAKADKDMGGTKWYSTVSAGIRAVDRLGTPELRSYLNASGGGNHPEMIRFMAKVGAMISEDRPATGGAEGAGKPAEAAHRLFPNDAPKGQ